MSKTDPWPTAQPAKVIVPSGWRAWLRRITRPVKERLPGDYPVMESLL